jgi:hypothetical protein
MGANIRVRSSYGLRIGIPIVGLLLIAIPCLKFINFPGFTPMYQPVDLRSLGTFPLDSSAGTIIDVPARWRALDGKKVQLDGFLWNPQERLNGMHAFQLVYDVPGSYQPIPPLVQERVFAKYRKPLPDIEFGRFYGTLHVKIEHDRDSTIMSVYRLDVDKIQDLNASAPSPPVSLLEFLTGCLFPVGIILLIVSGFRELLILIRRYPKKAAKKAFICQVCGYDLRATPVQCPECGTKVI